MQFIYDGHGKLAQRVDLTGAVTDHIGYLCEKNLPTSVETKFCALGRTLVVTSDGAAPSYLYPDYVQSTDAASNGAAVEYFPYGLPRNSTGVLSMVNDLLSRSDDEPTS